MNVETRIALKTSLVSLHVAKRNRTVEEVLPLFKGVTGIPSFVANSSSPPKRRRKALRNGSFWIEPTEGSDALIS
jgi:hypothetical protein